MSMKIYWDGFINDNDEVNHVGSSDDNDEVNHKGSSDINYKAKLTNYINRGLEYVNAPDNAEISITFVSKDEIHELNREYRGVDDPTDVLSFPFIDPDEWDKDIQPLALGDIIICTEIAREQAESYGHSFERELSFLLIHGLLHLAGYDHIQPEDEKEMRHAQREILGELK